MAASSKKIFLWFGIFIILIGIIFSIAGGVLSYSSYSFSRSAVSTSGVVTNVEVELSSNRNGTGGPVTYTYRPTISYFDHKGLPQSGQTYLSTSGYNYPIGTKLQVLYAPEDPHTVRLNNWFTLWGFGALFLFLGLIFVIGGVVFTRLSKKAKDQPDATSTASKQTNYSYSSADDPETQRPTIRRK